VPVSRKAKIAAVVVGSTAALALGGWYLFGHRPVALPLVPTGRILCPGDLGKIPASSAALVVGDFVVVQLASGDGKFHESTWAVVTSIGATTVVARISGEQLQTGIRPLQTKKHGFRVGNEILLSKDCIWDVYRPVTFSGQILCGPDLAALDTIEKPPLRALPAALTLDIGDRAQIVVASSEAAGTAWHEKLWTRVVSMSPTAQVVSALVDEEPTQNDKHALVKGSLLRFNRDCIVKVV
jgi:hypothetical protein